jgi:mRNA turnover protein 4
MAKALGTTPEEEHRPGLSALSEVRRSIPPRILAHNACYSFQQIKGQVGLLFTNSPPTEVTEWFADFQQPDFARSGNKASRTIILPAGPVMRVHSDPPEPFPHNEEPQLRKLGLTTSMVRGVPTLTAPHKICEKGKVLTAEQAQLLKLIGEKMVVFRVGLIARWEQESGQVVQVEGPRISEEDKEDAEVEEEDGMDE